MPVQTTQVPNVAIQADVASYFSQLKQYKEWSEIPFQCQKLAEDFLSFSQDSEALQARYHDLSRCLPYLSAEKSMAEMHDKILESEFPLFAALQNLEQQIQSNPDVFVSELWETSIKKNDDMLQLALLMTKALDDFTFRFDEPRLPNNQLILKNLKKIPQYSKKWPDLKFFNKKIPFKTNMYITCRHFVMHRLLVQANHLIGKFILNGENQFNSENDISKKLSPMTEHFFNELKFLASHSFLIDDEKLGLVLDHQFQCMHENNQNLKLGWVVTQNHVMSLRLQIKSKHGESYRAIEFFDPNVTNNRIRVEKLTSEETKALDFLSFMEGQGMRNAYLPNSQKHLMVQFFDSRLINNLENNLVIDQDVRKPVELILDFSEILLNASSFYYLMSFNVANSIHALKNDLNRLDPSQLTECLQAKNHEGVSGLLVALQHNCVQAIEALGLVLKEASTLSEQQKISVLSCQSPEGFHGIYLALKNNQVDSIRAFGDLLLQISPENRMSVLDVRENMDLLFMHGGRCDKRDKALKVFGDMLKKSLQEQEIALLLKKLQVQGDADLIQKMGLEHIKFPSASFFGKLGAMFG